MLGSKYQLVIVRTQNSNWREINLRSQGSVETFYSLRFDNFSIFNSEIWQNALPRTFVIQSYQFHEMEPIVCPRPTCRDVPHWIGVSKWLCPYDVALGNQVNETQIIAFKESLTKFWFSGIFTENILLIWYAEARELKQCHNSINHNLYLSIGGKCVGCFQRAGTGK